MGRKNGFKMFGYTDMIDKKKCRYPHCIVWTPIPVITWLIPIIGHMGIATSMGVIRDFQPHFVAEDDMAFGKPTKYWQMDMANGGGKDGWDRGVADASEEYNRRKHNLFCDNCYSFVAMALNIMKYNGNTEWNMVKLCFLLLYHSKYVSAWGFLKSWLPFMMICGIVLTIVLVTKMT